MLLATVLLLHFGLLSIKMLCCLYYLIVATVWFVGICKWVWDENFCWL